LRKKGSKASTRPVRALAARDVTSLRRELKKQTRQGPPRWNADPEDVQKSVARLVLALVEFVRKLLERQAVRRMEQRTLTRAELEKMGRALMQLEATVHDIAARFGLKPEELNLELGPLGKLS
jgi:hypothetical protein